MEEEPLLENNHKKGGLKAVAIIIGYSALEKMATVGLRANMSLYLMQQYHMEMAAASNIMFLCSAATNFMPLVGAIIADSYLGRFYTIGFGAVIYLMGLIILWTTTVIPQARPPPCDRSSYSCISPSFLQYSILCASLGFISTGAGAIMSSSLAFGVNQLENEDCQENDVVSGSYFSWCYVVNTLSIFIGLTCLVYIEDNMGWDVGFAVPVALVMFGTLVFFLSSSFYVKIQSNSGLFTGLIRVVRASFRNRHFKMPSDAGVLMYHYKNDPTPGLPSQSLRPVDAKIVVRFLNKACIVIHPAKDLTRDGRAKDPRSVCTVEQVEELKALFRVVPIWSTGVLMFGTLSHSPFQVLQASSADRRITSNLNMPAASFNLFAVIAVVLWTVLYDGVFVPMSSRLMGRPLHVSTRTRMEAGIFLSFFALIVTAVVESVRLARVGSESQWIMSALWLVPQYSLSGFAESINGVAQAEFYFTELPRSMSSIASILVELGIAVGHLLASLVMNVVRSVSRAWGHCWISSNINDGRYDYYYFLLTGLSVANLVYYLVCAKSYAERRVQSLN